VDGDVAECGDGEGAEVVRRERAQGRQCEKGVGSVIVEEERVGLPFLLEPLS
jgi:hypothetical protein